MALGEKSNNTPPICWVCLLGPRWTRGQLLRRRCKVERRRLGGRVALSCQEESIVSTMLERCPTVMISGGTRIRGGLTAAEEPYDLGNGIGNGRRPSYGLLRRGKRPATAR